MSSGELDRRVTFWRRPVTESVAGDDRGSLEGVLRVWAKFSPLSAETRRTYGYAEDAVTGWLKVRESKNVDQLTLADRVSFDLDPEGNDFEIDSVGIKDRGGYRLLRISRKM
ncbi:phage head completion protein [Bradyrhizobium sp. BR 1433]|uniref:phage head completion protein n=1 Tax=Bradyrhizobium sp. BR 1433 TaxID=3447967 RepID=UPI003EE57507